MSATPDPNVAVLLTDYSASVTGTATTVIAAETLPDDVRYLTITNNSASGTLWASHTGTATVGGVGSYAIGPAASKVYAAPAPVPVNALSLIASTGTIVATVQAGVHVD